MLKAVTELSQAFALAVPHEEATRIRDDVAFFQAVRAALAKSDTDEQRQPGRHRARRAADRLQGRRLG